VKQPWAWAILHGKDRENRSWAVPGYHLRELAIHAGAPSGWDKDGEQSPLVQAAWAKYLGPVHRLPRFVKTSDCLLHRASPLIPFGAIVAVAEGISCHHATDCQRPWQRGGCSPWGARDQYHWSWKVLHELAEPVPAKGMLGLWKVPEDTERAVRAQLETSRA
jgi:hypothetical protein